MQKATLLQQKAAIHRFGNGFEQNLAVANPVLWSPENPYLYKAVSKLYEGNQLKDETVTTFGIRTIDFNPQKGFSLNGQVRKFKGVCLHHDLGPLGAAVNIAAMAPPVENIKRYGLRCYPQFAQHAFAGAAGPL